MGAIASQIISLTIVYSIVYSDADQRKYQTSAPLAFVRGIHRGPMNSPHKWPVTRKMFPVDDVIMQCWINTFMNSLKLYQHPLTKLQPKAYTTLVPKCEKHPLFEDFGRKNTPFSTEIADFEAI